MTKYFIGYAKDDPELADVVAANSVEDLLGPNGGYDSADGPFTKHEAYAETRRSGEHVTVAAPDCDECADLAADHLENRERI